MKQYSPHSLVSIFVLYFLFFEFGDKCQTSIIALEIGVTPLESKILPLTVTCFPNKEDTLNLYFYLNLQKG